MASNNGILVCSLHFSFPELMAGLIDFYPKGTFCSKGRDTSSLSTNHIKNSSQLWGGGKSILVSAFSFPTKFSSILGSRSHDQDSMYTQASKVVIFCIKKILLSMRLKHGSQILQGQGQNDFISLHAAPCMVCPPWCKGSPWQVLPKSTLSRFPHLRHL